MFALVADLPSGIGFSVLMFSFSSRRATHSARKSISITPVPTNILQVNKECRTLWNQYNIETACFCWRAQLNLELVLSQTTFTLPVLV